MMIAQRGGVGIRLALDEGKGKTSEQVTTVISNWRHWWQVTKLLPQQLEQRLAAQAPALPAKGPHL